FGYQRITVERPLRLRFEVTEDTLALLQASKAFKTLSDDDGARLVTALKTLTAADGSTKKTFAAALRAALTAAGLTLSTAVTKAVWSTVSVPDADGELQTDSKGRPLPDPDLRDNENVPLGESIDDYM